MSVYRHYDNSNHDTWLFVDPNKIDPKISWELSA
jgi:hypothetical protein